LGILDRVALRTGVLRRNRSMDTISVLLAEDHAIVREGTRELLQHEEDLEVVGEAGDGEEAVELATGLRPDVVIMDIAMPKLNGIEATKQIKAYIFALLEAGAAGYLLKNVRGRELIEAIRLVAAGEAVLHPIVARKVIDRFALSPDRVDPGRALDQLTEREMEVLKLAAKGMTNRAIARELVISVRTVQAHFYNIFSKLGVGSRTEAVVYGLRKGWLLLEDAPGMEG
jgi:NarL family two-component system response regulator LiaR